MNTYPHPEDQAGFNMFQMVQNDPNEHHGTLCVLVIVVFPLKASLLKLTLIIRTGKTHNIVIYALLCTFISQMIVFLHLFYG